MHWVDVKYNKENLEVSDSFLNLEMLALQIVQFVLDTSIAWHFLLFLSKSSRNLIVSILCLYFNLWQLFSRYLICSIILILLKKCTIKSFRN